MKDELKLIWLYRISLSLFYEFAFLATLCVWISVKLIKIIGYNYIVFLLTGDRNILSLWLKSFCLQLKLAYNTLFLRQVLKIQNIEKSFFVNRSSLMKGSIRCMEGKKSWLQKLAKINHSLIIFHTKMKAYEYDN